MKTYALDHSASFNMQIEKLFKKKTFFQKTAKKRVLPFGGGGSQNL